MEIGAYVAGITDDVEGQEKPSCEDVGGTAVNACETRSGGYVPSPFAGGTRRKIWERNVRQIFVLVYRRLVLDRPSHVVVIRRFIRLSKYI